MGDALRVEPATAIPTQHSCANFQLLRVIHRNTKWRSHQPCKYLQAWARRERRRHSACGATNHVARPRSRSSHSSVATTTTQHHPDDQLDSYGTSSGDDRPYEQCGPARAAAPRHLSQRDVARPSKTPVGQRCLHYPLSLPPTTCLYTSFLAPSDWRLQKSAGRHSFRL